MGLIEEEGMMEWEEYRKIDLTKESWGVVGGNNACTLVLYLCALLLPMGAFTLFFVRSNNTVLRLTRNLILNGESKPETNLYSPGH